MATSFALILLITLLLAIPGHVAMKISDGRGAEVQSAVLRLCTQAYTILILPVHFSLR